MSEKEEGDLVADLREYAHFDDDNPLMLAAADEIEKLKSKNEILRKALVVAVRAIESHREDHFDTWLVDTPIEWDLDPKQDGLCSSRKLVEKLSEIAGDDNG